ncbi:MAG: hypothetical protein AAGB03_03345 [Pseudomonadota bacterium]
MGELMAFVPEGVAPMTFFGGIGLFLAMFIAGIISNLSAKRNLQRFQRIPQELSPSKAK